MIHNIFLLVLAAGLNAVTAKLTETVWIDSGPVRGEEVTYEGYNYTIFKGIPYAAPPVGDLRFQAPQPPKKWTEIRDTTIYGKWCYQPRYNDISSEDCLTLNVFTPWLGRHNLKPVLVIIHGGFFLRGGTDELSEDPVFLVQQDIVVVTFNYRLGALGFLSTNTADATGNWGLKDQVAALKWVQSNIAQFGGDPTQVTIYGYSAGSACVHFHLLSPLSKGLFKRGILSAGVAIDNRVLKSQNQQERYSRNLARLLRASEREYTDPERRIQFLRAADPIEISKLSIEVFDEQDLSDPMMVPMYPFTPVIEAPGTEGAFLTQDPIKLLATGMFTRVPLMMGLNDLEGGLLYTKRFGIKEKITPEGRGKIEANICEALPQPLKDEAIARNECSQVTQQFREVYFDGQGFNSTLLNFVYLWGDLYKSKDMYFSQRMHAQFSDQENPVYNYYFTFDGKWNAFKLKLQVPLPGATHTDDLSYLFLQRRLPTISLPESSPEVITRKRLISFYTNFVKTGNPTPELSELVPVKWLPSEGEDMSWMVIGNDLTMENVILKLRMDLWDELYEKYGGHYARPSTTGSWINRMCCDLLKCFGWEKYWD